MIRKQYNVEGMSCNHCRMSVEKALNSIEGVTAVVNLDPPAASMEFEAEEIPLSELQKIVSEAGNFRLSEK